MTYSKKIFEKVYFNSFIKYIPKDKNKNEIEKFIKHPELVYLSKDKIYIKDNKQLYNIINNLLD